MIALRNDIVFIASACFFAVHYLAEWCGLHWWFADHYLDDVLCLPVVVPVALAVMRLHPQHQNMTVHWTHVVVPFVWVAVLFEWILPATSSNYTADVMDVVCYAAGGLVWFGYQTMHQKNNRRMVVLSPNIHR